MFERINGRKAWGIGLGFVLVISALALSQNSLPTQAQEAVNPVDDGVTFDSYANETSEMGDGSICADYEEGEIPPGHLNCDELTNETDDEVRSPTEEDLEPKLTEENFDEFENPKAENPVDDGVTVIGDLPVPVGGILASECRDEFMGAFDILERRDPASFEFVNDHIGDIRCEELYTRVHVANGTMIAGRGSWDASHATNLDAKLSNLGAVMVHEACHVEQFERQHWFLRWIGWIPYGEEAEIECMKAQLQTTINLGYDDQWLRQMINDPEFREQNKYWEKGMRGTY